MSATHNEHRLRQELERVSLRYRRLLRGFGLALCWLALAAAGAALLAAARGAGYAVPVAVLVVLAAAPFVVVPVLLSALRAARNPVWLARRIEQRYPDLDARLLAALEQRPDGAGGQLGFLQQTVVAEALDHAKVHPWGRLVSDRRLRAARWANGLTLALLAAVAVGLFLDWRSRPSGSGWLGGAFARKPAPYDLKVEPEDTSIERGTSLLVLARFGEKFGNRLPADVQLLLRDADGGEKRVTMSKSLDDPIFAGRVPSVGRDLTYAVRYGDSQTRWYKVSVFDYPDLKQADARLQFPEYTGMNEAVVEDTRSVTAVEGTRATLTFHLNKPVADATLVPGQPRQSTEGAPAAPAVPVKLSADPSDPSVYTVSLDLAQSQRYRLHLKDDQGRANKQPPELVVNVTPNRPPDLKLEWPGRDVDVSPLEEVALKAKVWDDFGVRRVGLSYAMAGEEPKEVVLAEGVAGRERREVAHLVALEQLAARADQLLSYYFWAEDVGPDGAVRRTMGDMFFAEVRPFDEIFRQGQPPPQGQQQQQQQQQGSQNAQEAEELAELQKQIIAATWKVMRREVSAKPSPQFVPDVKLIAESQGAAKEQAAAMDERLTDERSKAHLRNVLKFMDAAAVQLAAAAGRPAVDPLSAALPAEQAAYQELLKLRAREHDVVRSNQRQQRGQSSSSASARRQRQLDQLDLENQENRYQTQTSAAGQQQEQDPQQRETRQVLNRLRELAQRQEDLNRQMQELQSALNAAQDQAQREEIQRQLARLREQQQQMLRDTDELRDRMDRPENQERMAESRQQLEETRSNVRRASEALEQGMVPEASAAGARAGEQLNNLRDEFRRAAAGQFNEAVTQMREEARGLDERQQEVSQRLSELDEMGQPKQPQQEQRTLRDTGSRQQIAQDLQQQQQRLEQLLNNMKQTVEEAETAEPLLSRQLYDAIREARQQKTDQALDASRQMLERGFVEESKAVEGEATKGIARLRQDVEQAAASVLGDEAEGLRRARDELDALAQELDREIGRARGEDPSTRPSSEDGQLAQNTTGARRGEPQDGQPGEGQQGEQARAGDQPSSQPGERQQQPGQPGERSPQARGGSQQQQQQQQPQPGQGQRGGQQPSESGQARTQGGQPQEGQPGEQPGQGDGQQRGGQQQADARQQGGRQAGGQQPQQGEGQQPGQARAGGLRQSGGQQRQRGGENPDGELRRLLPDGGGGARGGPEEVAAGPITGEQFREWSDRLRDVEEMVGDPRLRAEAARIRERARAARAEFTRHSKQPNWDLVRESIGRPLLDLRDQVAEELLRRDSAEALVPIDREPVPPEYAEQVRRYYERLGSGQ